MAKSTTTRPALAPSPAPAPASAPTPAPGLPRLDDVEIEFARVRLAWLERADLNLVGSLLAGGELEHHLRQRAQEAARHLAYRTRTLGERPDLARKAVIEEKLAPVEMDAPEPPAAMVETVRRQLAEWKKSPAGRAILEGTE